MSPLRVLFSFPIRIYIRGLGKITSLYKRLRTSKPVNAGADGADGTLRDINLSKEAREHIREIIKRLRNNKIENPSFMWETHFNYGIQSCMYECLKQIQKIERDERAANTVKKNKRA
jgi:hypothetical protein